MGQLKEITEDSTHVMVITFLNEELGESFYYLRKRNANFSYFILNNPGVAKTVYLSKVLGHEVNNEATAVCYQSYHILDDVGQQQERERRETERALSRIVFGLGYKGRRFRPKPQELDMSKLVCIWHLLCPRAT